MDSVLRTIGVDLTDLTGRKAGRSCLVELNWEDGTWWASQLGRPPDLKKAILRELAAGSVVAIDGPQGLAGAEAATMRLAEHDLGTPGKTPVSFPSPRMPYGGFIRGSVELFAELVKDPATRLFGLETNETAADNLIEVFPGAAWPLFRKRFELQKPVGFTKRSPKVRELNATVLKRLGIRIGRGIPNDDFLDAAMAAYTAFCFKLGMAQIHGATPWIDHHTGHLREGYIIQPTVQRLGARVQEFQGSFSNSRLAS